MSIEGHRVHRTWFNYNCFGVRLDHGLVIKPGKPAEKKQREETTPRSVVSRVADPDLGLLVGYESEF